MKPVNSDDACEKNRHISLSLKKITLLFFRLTIVKYVRQIMTFWRVNN